MSGLIVPVLAALLAAAPVQVGQPAPALDGVPGTFDGQVSLVVFWATWCRACHAAFPDLAPMQRALDGRLRIVLIEAGEAPAEVRAFLAANPPPSNAIITTDVTNAVQHRWRISALPWFFLVDQNGTVALTSRGWDHGSAADFVAAAHRLFGDTPAPAPSRAGSRRKRGARPAAAARAGPPAREVVKGVEILRGP